jgi:hypothetical protein
MKKLTQEEVKLQILNGLINPVYTNNGARQLRANEIRSYEIQANKIFGIFVAEAMEDGFVKEKLFDFDLTRKKEGDDWQLTYDYHVAKNAALLYFPDDMRKQTHRYYREGNTALTESGVLTRPALLLVEGDVTDSEGQKTTYTRELIDSIVATSNEYALTQEIKLFTDHEYSQKNRIGSVTGKFTAREIVETDLPENSDRDSIGKYAIFNDGIEIRDEKAIEKYHSKLLKELSIGIILQKNTGTIFEVSAVPWGAVKEAHIYSGEPDTDIKKYAFSFESQMRRAQKEWTEDDMKSMDARERGYYAFSRAMDNIIDATDDELPKSRYKSIKLTVTAFSDYLMGIYAPKPDEDVADVPITIMEKPKMPTDETKTYSAADFEALQSQLAKVQKDNQDTRKFSALKDRAIALNQSGKLSAAKYKATFEGDQAFANYQAAITGDPLESFLNYVDENITPDVRLQPMVYGATPIFNQAVPDRPSADAIDKSVDEAAAETLKNYKRKYGVK